MKITRVRKHFYIVEVSFWESQLMPSFHLIYQNIKIDPLDTTGCSRKTFLNNFICESANIKNIDPLFENIPIVKNKIENVNLGYVLSNSFGFGGTNATLTFKHPDK